MKELDQAINDLSMIRNQVVVRETTRKGDLFLLGRIEGLKEAIEVLETIRDETHEN